MANLYNKIGEYTADNLISNVTDVVVGAGTIKGGAATYKRGTVLSKNASGKLEICGTASTTAYCILCDDITVDTADVTVPVYLAGTFNANALTVKDAYTMTAADIDALRNGGIFIKSMQA